MYQVKSLVPGILCLDLEEGSTNVRSGQTINLELYCSRKWIETNPTLRSLINRRALMVILDDATAGVPKVDLKSVAPRASAILQQAQVISVPPRAAPPRMVAPAPLPPIAIANIPAPVSATEPIVIDLGTNKVTAPKVEMVAEPPTINLPEVGKQYAEQDLRRMVLSDVKIIAASMGLDVSPPTSKTRMIKMILSTYAETSV